VTFTSNLKKNRRSHSVPQFRKRARSNQRAQKRISIKMNGKKFRKRRRKRIKFTTKLHPIMQNRQFWSRSLNQTNQLPRKNWDTKTKHKPNYHSQTTNPANLTRCHSHLFTSRVSQILCHQCHSISWGNRIPCHLYHNICQTISIKCHQQLISQVNSSTNQIFHIPEMGRLRNLKCSLMLNHSNRKKRSQKR